MLQRNDSLDALATLLDTGADRPLTESERTLLRFALAELAGAQTTIAHQSALLASYEHDTRTLETATADALGRLRSLVDGSADLPAYDFSAANSARAQLLRTLDDAAHGRDALEAILRFVAAAGRLIL